MKKLLVAMSALLAAGYAGAGDYHKASTLRCSQCHTMHASRQHQLNGAAEDTDYPVAQQGVPNNKLLIKAGTNETCLACHNAVAAYPDVLGLNGGMVPANTRSGGALNGTVGSHSSAGYEAWAGHTLGSTATPPGYEFTYEPSAEGFNCANCHAVHGSVAYRNLGLSSYMGLATFAHDATNPFTAKGPTYNPLVGAARTGGLVNDGTLDVFIEVAARDYATANVSFGVGSASVAPRAPGGMNSYCAVCHGNFHGTANTADLVGGVDFVRHPTTGVARADGTSLLTTGQIGLTDVVRPAWTTAAGGGFEAACLSCHKGHGNARGYGLIYPSLAVAAVADFENGDAAAEADGTYPLRNLCITCHPMGRY